MGRMRELQGGWRTTLASPLTPLFSTSPPHAPFPWPVAECCCEGLVSHAASLFTILTYFPSSSFSLSLSLPLLSLCLSLSVLVSTLTLRIIHSLSQSFLAFYLTQSSSVTQCLLSAPLPVRPRFGGFAN